MSLSPARSVRAAQATRISHVFPSTFDHRLRSEKRRLLTHLPANGPQLSHPRPRSSGKKLARSLTGLRGARTTKLLNECSPKETLPSLTLLPIWYRTPTGDRRRWPSVDRSLKDKHTQSAALVTADALANKAGGGERRGSQLKLELRKRERGEGKGNPGFVGRSRAGFRLRTDGRTDGRTEGRIEAPRLLIAARLSCRQRAHYQERKWTLVAKAHRPGFQNSSILLVCCVHFKLVNRPKVLLTKPNMRLSQYRYNNGAGFPMSCLTTHVVGVSRELSPSLLSLFPETEKSASTFRFCGLGDREEEEEALAEEEEEEAPSMELRLEKEKRKTQVKGSQAPLLLFSILR